jgi:hypothetical protein
MALASKVAIGAVTLNGVPASPSGVEIMDQNGGQVNLVLSGKAVGPDVLLGAGAALTSYDADTKVAVVNITATADVGQNLTVYALKGLLPVGDPSNIVVAAPAS